MSHDAAIGLVQGVLALGINLRFLYVDTVGDPERYQAKLADLFPTMRVVVEKKADSTFPIVSAASICAKVATAATDRSARAEPWNGAEQRNALTAPVPPPPP